MKQVSGLESDLNIVSTDDRFANISQGSLEASARIFIYLYPMAEKCPFEEFNSWFRNLSLFYNDLFKTQSGDKIILTLNRIIKTASEQNKEKDVAKDILTRTAALLSLKYEDIQSVLPQKSHNISHIRKSQILESSDGMFGNAM